MKLLKSAAAAALAMLITAVLIIFPSAHIRKAEGSEKLIVRTISLPRKEDAVILSNAELFEILGENSKAIIYMTEIPSEKREEYADFTEEFLNEHLLKDISFPIDNMEVNGFRYITISKDETIITLDLILVSSEFITVCFEKESGTAIFGAMTDKAADSLKNESGYLFEVFRNNILAYYSENGLLDYLINYGYFPQETLEKISAYPDLFILQDEESIIFGSYPAALQLKE